MKYLLDANVFIAANNLHYGLDFCPAFWDWLLAANYRQSVYSIEKVGDEIEAGEDQLSEWAKGCGEHFFLKPDAKVLEVMAEVSQWVTSNGYTPAAINTFLQVADYWLVAHARHCTHGRCLHGTSIRQRHQPAERDGIGWTARIPSHGVARIRLVALPITG
ncbi:DUF4411 family protein [Acidihalobacter ferrooxydans]|uniref:DUF4411 family protein n=1 Tax=Acidihalobacter ferrooxydans TaxID=1765967 RepID=A0A1P8UFA5_9GAMM|nr:DUF4411 family protein [Acidihalobacter ferrooxydans]APZ42527.1 hypothetical protein BW247_04995 [Acidihalobacter ferrooxydans]